MSNGVDGAAHIGRSTWAERACSKPDDAWTPVRTEQIGRRAGRREKADETWGKMQVREKWGWWKGGEKSHELT
jgi:hypothetical protein